MNDGVILPTGNLVKRINHKGSLNYDEFIVYNTSRIKIRYLCVVSIKQ